MRMENTETRTTTTRDIPLAVCWHLARFNKGAGDYEMAEIFANDNLVKRLKKGSEDARKRRGRFVE